jgi:hypothetical protein
MLTKNLSENQYQQICRRGIADHENDRRANFLIFHGRSEGGCHRLGDAQPPGPFCVILVESSDSRRIRHCVPPKSSFHQGQTRRICGSAKYCGRSRRRCSMAQFRKSGRATAIGTVCTDGSGGIAGSTAGCENRGRTIES